MSSLSVDKLKHAGHLTCYLLLAHTVDIQHTHFPLRPDKQMCISHMSCHACVQAHLQLIHLGRQLCELIAL